MYRKLIGGQQKSIARKKTNEVQYSIRCWYAFFVAMSSWNVRYKNRPYIYWNDMQHNGNGGDETIFNECNKLNFQLQSSTYIITKFTESLD